MASTSNILKSIGGWPGAVSTGIGLFGGLSSLFGGNGNNAAFKRAQANANGEADRIGGAQDWYQGQANDETRFFNEDNAAAREAAGKYLGFLKTDPYTSGRMAFELNRAKGGLDANIARARYSNIARSMGTGNITPSGAPSSTSAGVDAYLQAQDILGTNRAQNQVAEAQYNNLGQRLSAATDLEEGLANTDYGRAEANQGAYVDASGRLMNFWQDQANGDRAAAAQDSAAGMGALAGLGQQIAYGPSMRSAYDAIWKSLGKPGSAPQGSGGGYGGGFMFIPPTPYTGPYIQTPYGGQVPAY